MQKGAAVKAKAKAKAAPSDGLAVLGVTFADYAFVTAGLADGLALRDLLEHRELDATSWSDVEEGWLALMLEDLDKGGALMLELDLRQQEARKIWERPIPPLDQDLRAWLDFQRGLAGGPDLRSRLAALGIGVADLGRLQRTWTARLEADPALRKRATDILSEPVGAVEVPPVPRPKLPAPARPVGSGTGFFRLDLGDVALPFKGDDAEPDLREPAPALVLPLPQPPVEPVKPAHDLDGTSTVGVVIEGLDLPFVAPNEADIAPPTPTEPSQAVTAPAPVEPAIPAPPAPPVVRTGSTHAAALIDDAALATLRARIAARPRSVLDETSVGTVAPVEAPLPFAASTSKAADATASLDETGALSLEAIWGPALPFEGGKGAVPVPLVEPHPEQGGTADVSRAALAYQPTEPLRREPVPATDQPPVAATPAATVSSSGPKFPGTVAVTEDLDADRLRELARMAKGLPFAAPSTVPRPPGAAVSTPASAPTGTVAVTEDLDVDRLRELARMAKGHPFAAKTTTSAAPTASTAPLPPPRASAGAAPTGPTAPGTAATASTGANRAEPLAGPGTLTLEQYAAVETEIGLNPANAARVLAHYGLSALSRQRHADVLRALIARNATVRTRWQEAVATYRKWRLGR